MSVQVLVTFHGGMVALGYEWGSMDHPRGQDACPDHAAHKDMAESMARSVSELFAYVLGHSFEH